MPLYDFHCDHCDVRFEKALPLKDWDAVQLCPHCGEETLKLITLGGIQDEHPVWLDNSIRSQIQDPSERPIQTRTEYNRYLKENGIVPTN
jgi:putative FmdB family regulatory protein